tara:strand:+ start:357 stop:1139 length:783 start_codon:yes stop_codon:yes gene_type:complete
MTKKQKTKEPVEKQEEVVETTTLLIDADSLLYFEMGKDTLEEAIKSIDDRITEMMNKCGATHFVGFLTIGRCYRYDIARTQPYKGNRKNGDKPIIFYALREHLKQQYNMAYAPALEADDLVSAYHSMPGYNTIICSPDKDVLYQNEGTHYNYGKATFVTTTKSDSEKFLWKQMLMGDSGDGIPGLPKVGIKTAESWLKEIPLEEMPSFVLNKYIEKFGNSEGINKFAETFKLVYILKSKEDVLRETGIELPNLVINDVKN